MRHLAIRRFVWMLGALVLLGAAVFAWLASA